MKITHIFERPRGKVGVKVVWRQHVMREFWFDHPWQAERFVEDVRSKRIGNRQGMESLQTELLACKQMRDWGIGRIVE